MSPTKIVRRVGALAAVLIGLVVALIVAFVLLIIFVFPDDAPDKEELTDDSEASGQVVETGDLDGNWTVVPGAGDTETYAGYRVEEVFAAGARSATAIGRTHDVTGELTVAGSEVTEGGVTVDVTTLDSDQDRRDNAIRDRGLQTDEFPEATFSLTEPVTLPELKDGIVSQVEVQGELTLHGVTQPVTVDLSVRPSGEVFTIDASVPVVFADYDIEAPSIGGFVSVEDEGSLEFRISFERS